MRGLGFRRTKDEGLGFIKIKMRGFGFRRTKDEGSRVHKD